MRLENSSFSATIWSLVHPDNDMNLYRLVRQIITLTRTPSIMKDFICVAQKLALRIDILYHIHL